MKISKTLWIFFTLIFFAIQCNSGQIRIKKDKFSNTSTLSMVLTHLSDSFFAGRLNETYLREFSKQETKPLIMQLSIIAPVTYDFPHDDLQIKINDKIYKAPTGNISGENHTSVDNNGNTSQYKLFKATLYFTK